jgi:RNA polymerase sigma-70 factor (ECF subfamily)
MGQNQEDRSDEQLMIAYQSGDHQAFQILYLRHSQKVYSFLRKRLIRSEEVDEVFQQVFTKLHQARRTYNPTYAFLQWLYVISKTALLDFWSKQNRILEVLHKEASEVQETIDSRTEDTNQEFPILEPGFATLSGLPAEQRKAVEWRVLDELSYQEIATLLNCSQANVRQLVSRAIKKIRNSIGNASSRQSTSRKRGGL